MKNLKALTLISVLVLCLFSVLLFSACTESISIDGLAFEGASYVYDGTPKTIQVIGVPQGASLVYDTTNTYTDAGTYPVTATVTTEAGDKIVLKATLTITKARYDMSGITLNSQSFIYDGQNKSIEISGTLPEGVSVSYEGNDKNSLGSHTVTAKFTSSNNNYEEIPNMVASYVIYNASGLPSYEIIFDSNGGSEVEKQAVLHGGLITQPENPTKADYNFNGWYYNDSLWSFDSKIVDREITLVAKWKSVYTYMENESGGITLTGYAGNVSEIVFPETIDGFTVTEIGKLSLSENVTSVTIPSTVKTIKAEAFSSLKQLNSIVIPYGVETIEENAFGYLGYFGASSCTSLESIVLPESIKTIGSGAFSGCTSLKSIKFPSSLKAIPASVLSGCTSLTSVEISNGTKSIGDSAFSGCVKLKTLIIPESVINLGSNVFNDCDSLEYKTSNNIRYLGTNTNPYLILVQGFDTASTSIEINSNTRFIYASAFKNYSQITSVSIPSKVTSIGAGAFSDCVKLVTVNIPSGVTEICASTFSGCTALASITLPQGLTKIERSAFSECKTLKAIAIPDNVTEIGKSAFYRCSELIAVNIGVNSKLEIIDEEAFSGANFTSIYIPKGIKALDIHSIGSYSLKTLIIAKDSQLETLDAFVTHGNVTTVYYGGSAEDWFNIGIDSWNEDILNATRYYYSETKPTESGNYWYYDEKTNSPVIW